MSTPSCQQENCHYDAFQKCTSCGRVFCQQHIAFMNPLGNDQTYGWKCKECAAKLIVKTNQRLRQWGWINIGAIAAIVIGILWGISDWNDWNILLLVGGIIAITVGLTVWLINLILRSRFQTFYKNNFV